MRAYTGFEYSHQEFLRPGDSVSMVKMPGTAGPTDPLQEVVLKLVSFGFRDILEVYGTSEVSSI
jgi:hypothetical protein